MEEIVEKRAQVLQQKEKKREALEVNKKRRIVEKASEQVARREDKAAFKRFNALWTPKAIREAGDKLQKLVKSKESHQGWKALYCSYIPQQYKVN